MSITMTRRQCLAAVSAVPATGALLGMGPAVFSRAAPPDAFPAQDPDVVRDMVIASHGNIDRATAFLKDFPRLANAAYDWGFGDWETCLGAAAHTGRRKLAAILLEHGARPDIFAAAMLGNLDVVRAMVEAQPGLQRTRGPHGLTLMHHARAGGAESTKVVEFLEKLADADVPYQDLPLSDAERDSCTGEYAFGTHDDQRFRIFIPEKDTHLSIQRGTGFPRRLFHQGGLAFHPIGAPEVRVTCSPENGRAARVTIASPGAPLTATRV